MAISCPIQAVVSKQVWKELQDRFAFDLVLFVERKTQHLSQPIRRKVEHKYYLSADSITAFVVSLVYWVNNTVHC